VKRKIGAGRVAGTSGCIFRKIYDMSGAKEKAVAALCTTSAAIIANCPEQKIVCYQSSRVLLRKKFILTLPEMRRCASMPT
jgi:hypothetical protein